MKFFIRIANQENFLSGSKKVKILLAIRFSLTENQIAKQLAWLFGKSRYLAF
jgi:hypothetical protein